jgi:nucleotide-binding universal stress UspA family protein
LTVATRVTDGYVAEAILDYAEQNKIDLIAMSTHGRSGVRRMLLGSTADRVVHGAKMPVLLVRPEEAR